jgi:hypothetical protein
MARVKIFIVFVFGLLILGCASSVKKGFNKDTIQNASEWKYIAKDMARKISKDINKTSIYIEPAVSDAKTPFERVFLKLLRDEFVNMGVNVKTAPFGADTLFVNVDLIEKENSYFDEINIDAVLYDDNRYISGVNRVFNIKKSDKNIYALQKCAVLNVKGE